ncbi:MAG: hypothetical protein Kow0020_03020 [Wenzhouxiangellaceae bacterium]
MTRALLAALLTVSAAAALWWGATGLGFDRPITWLEIRGDLERVTASQIRAAVAGHAARGFFGIDLEAARDAVEALPWVAGAQLARSWPDVLTIEVVEHRAVARFNDDLLISSTGELFRVAGTTGMQGLPRLVGPEAQAQDIFRMWLDLRALLHPRRLDIARLEMDRRGEWRLELADQRQLLLGRESPRERVARFLAVRPELDRIEGVKRIDLRYPNGLAVVRGSEADEAQEQLAQRKHTHANSEYGQKS